MFLSPRISSRDLGELSHRLAVETESGIDIRRTWKREADSARPRYRDDFRRISDAVNRGESLSSSIAGTGRLFPPLFREIVDVGEKTGTLGRVFHRLSAHYRKAVEMQRLFLTSIAWPMIQLGMAIVVIGLLIWILGVIATRNNGQAIDILGFGLVGNRGLLIYTNFIIAVGLCIAGIVVAFRRGAFWIRPLQHLAMKIPGFGAALEKLALARLTWALHLTMNVEMDLRQLVPLVLRATGNDYYIRHTDQATRLVATGHPIHEAFAATGAFPADFLDALEVAEESGAVVESMERLSKRYDEESQAALKVITIFAGVAVWLIVMGLIILLIFRIFGFYLGTINDALKMTQ
ncbi:MAG: type II secretion system F family protein [Pirellulales bacterium]